VKAPEQDTLLGRTRDLNPISRTAVGESGSIRMAVHGMDDNAIIPLTPGWPPVSATS